jgi:hypothetical protein
MKNIIFSIILSFVFSFQAYGANKVFKPVGSQKPNPSIMISKPSGSMELMIKKPDLMVQKFVLSPSSVQNGERCDYELVVKNIGGPSSLSKILVGFYQPNKHGRSDYLSVPGPGQSLTFQGRLSVPADKCMAVTYTVNLDVHKLINESNENNNTASYSIGIQGRPIIGFCKRLGKGTPCKDLFINGGVNSDMYIGFEVYNFGCSVSPAGTMDLNFPEQWPQTIQIPPIQPGKLFAFYTYMRWSTPGVKNGEIILRYNQGNVEIFDDRIKYKVNIVEP